MSIQNKVISRLKTLMQEKNLNQKQMAELAGIPYQSLYKFFSGQRGITLRFLEKLANGLDCEVQSLFPPSEDAVIPIDKNELHEVLVNSLRKIRKIDQFEELSATERHELFELVEQFGGWKFLISFLREEIEIRREAQRDYIKLRDSITENMSKSEVSSIKKKMIISNLISKANG